MAEARYEEPIDLSSSTVLITGGSSGIGFGLARCFVQAGANVIITGRREEQLKTAADELKSLGKGQVIFRVNDVEKASDREQLYQWIVDEHPQTNILLNNAGIQNRYPIIPNEDESKNVSWAEREKELEINVSAPIHLSHLFIKHFRQMKCRTAIINVSSGLAFVPLASISIYSASKAALHSFTMSLRYELSNEIPSIQVYEIVPPAVQTNLGGSHAFGEPLEAYCQSTFEGLTRGEQEIGYKRSDEWRKFGSRNAVDHGFVALNEQFSKMIANLHKSQ